VDRSWNACSRILLSVQIKKWRKNYDGADVLKGVVLFKLFLQSTTKILKIILIYSNLQSMVILNAYKKPLRS